jgi:Leucine-rich repeat (LRR) protein
MRKKKLTLLLVCIICMLTSYQVFAIPKGKSVTFKDKNLENAIRRNINKKMGAIYLDDVKKIKSLNLEDSSITNLQGLENFTNLSLLYLSGNKIKNLEPLKGMISLNTLFLGSNNIINIDPLKGLTN